MLGSILYFCYNGKKIREALSMTTRKKITYQNLFFFALLLFAYLVTTLFLFHRQTVSYGGLYPSDVHNYIAEMLGEDTGYDFPYPILFLTGRLFLPFTSPEHAMALAITLWNGLTPLALKYYFDRFMLVRDADTARRGIFSTLLVFSLLFVSMLYPLTYLGRYHTLDEGFLYRYLGTFTPNPYHNATYLTARPFSVVTFFLFADILDFYEKEDGWYHPKYLCFSLSLLLTTLAKPSFTLALVSAAGIIMLWRLLSCRFQKFKAFFQMGIWFIPTFLVLLYQFRSVFRPDSDTSNGVGFGFLTAWSTLTDNVPLSILLGTAFPLTVLLFSLLQRHIPGLLKFSWQFFLTALLMLIFLYEKGYRLPHVNFSWGYMYGLFFACTVSLLVLAKNTLQHRHPAWQLGIQWIVYGLHLICGIDYFRILLQGGLFH